MKKLVLLALVAVVLTTACDSKKKELEAAQALQDATRQELEEAVANRDSLLTLVNEISTGMDQIKSLENIVTLPDGENDNQRAKILNDIVVIQRTLEQRKQQLAELEKKLNKSNLTNSELRKTIETLRQQIDSQSAEIQTLRANLKIANDKIDELTGAVDSLNTAVDTISSQRDAAIERGTELANELNTCYYVAANSKELKEHKILESGFLRKTKLMESDFDLNFFTKADKRTLTSINLYSKKAKVLTKQPENSYQIVDVNGSKVLKITNPAAFWNLSNYLVVEID